MPCTTLCNNAYLSSSANAPASRLTPRLTFTLHLLPHTSSQHFQARPISPSPRAPTLRSSKLTPPHLAEEAYLALDQGAISDTHVLVVPIDHAASSADLKAGAFAEMERWALL